MQKIIILLALLLFQNSFAKAPDAVSELNQRLSNLHEFSADFTQNTFNSQHKSLQESSGKMALLRPGNFKWESLSPNHQLLITNGKSLWVYDVDLEQVTQQALSNQGDLNPAQLLSGSIESLEKKFIVFQEANRKYNVFLLQPKAKDSGVKWIRLYFKAQNLSMMEFANELGETNEFKFSHIKTDLNLKPSYFNFIPPKGVDVLVNQ